MDTETDAVREWERAHGRQMRVRCWCGGVMGWHACRCCGRSVWGDLLLLYPHAFPTGWAIEECHREDEARS